MLFMAHLKKFFKMGWLGSCVRFMMETHLQMRPHTIDSDKKTMRSAVWNLRKTL